MCTVCGCDSQSQHKHSIASERGRRAHPHNDHHHHDAHDHHHHYGKNEIGLSVAGHDTAELIEIERDILSKNDRYADANRLRLKELNTLALNLVSSPGAGKTTLLEKTVLGLKSRVSISVVEGDQETANDAERIRVLGVPAVQVNTGRGCHLDAHMVGHAIGDLNPQQDSVVFIENVGNLVCPASFDLGEAAKVVILSVTEGDDKPLKYPDMFDAADVLILSKIDLLPYVPFDVEKAIDCALRINPNLQILQLSALTSEGMQEWFDVIERMRPSAIDAGTEPDVSRLSEQAGGGSYA